MGGTSERIRRELTELQRQRQSYLAAAMVCSDRLVALRRLLAVERLDEEIAALEEALDALDPDTDDMTLPMRIRDFGVTEGMGL